MRLSLAAAVLAASLAAQVKEPKTGGPFAVTLQQPKTTYQIYVPEKYDATRSWPLVVGLHPARTPATATMQWWLPEARKRGYFVLCPKAKGDRWEDRDGRIILAALADLRKKYRIDPDRIALGGYSSGAFMATRWGLHQDKLWRCVFAHAGADVSGSLKVAKTRMAVCLTCGEDDGFLRYARKAREALQKHKVSVHYETFPGMAHHKTTPAVWQTAYGFFDRNFDSPAWRLERARLADKGGRFVDAILALDPVTKLAGKQHKKVRAAATKLLKRVDRAGAKELARAKRMMAKKPAEAKRLLAEIARRFPGRDCAAEANKLLGQ